MQKVIFAIILFLIYGAMWGTDRLYHEIAGTILGVLILWHLYNNRKWFTMITKGKYPTKRLLMLICNVGFLICMLGTLITGLMFSRELFATLPIHQKGRFFFKLHESFAYGTVFFLICHTYLHWVVVKNYLLKLVGKK